jgi:hypothetical protein
MSSFPVASFLGVERAYRDRTFSAIRKTPAPHRVDAGAVGITRQAYCRTRSALLFGGITASPRDRNLIYVLFFPIVFREDRVYE